MRRRAKILSATRRAGLAALLVGASVVRLRAQDPLRPPAPLVGPSAAPAPGAGIVTRSAAQRAHDLGLPSVAAQLYRQLLDEPGADRRTLTLARATALLDAGRAAEAEQALATIAEPRDAAWRVRAGLAALQLRKRDAAQAEWDAIKANEVPPEDRPWYSFLTGALYDTATPRDITRANLHYKAAEDSAPTELSRARFQLAGERVRLEQLGKPSDSALRTARETAESFRGQAIGYEATRQYAVMLAQSDQRADAVEVLRQALLAVPAQERRARDELRFFLGLIGDRGRNGAGRNALVQVLETGGSAERQRQALQLLAAESKSEPEREQLAVLLKKLIDAKPDHPIKQSLLFHRAQLALGERDYVQAEDDANALVRQFPGSPLRLHALGLLAQSAWEQRRYRNAADAASRARAELLGESPAPGARPLVAAKAALAEFGVLEAEAWFRAGLYPQAAEAYAAVLRERPAALGAKRVGELMFQRVLAEIKSNSGQAGRVLDELQRDPAFDVESRWQAEWSLVRALQLEGDAGIQEAFSRVNNLLREPPPDASALKPDLRARMMWLQARLAFEHGQPAQTIELVDAWLKSPLAIEAALKQEISSTLVLLKARAQFALGQELEALGTLKRLRIEFPNTDATISSHLVESEHYAANDQIDKARKALIDLTDNEAYRTSPYVPYALFRLALLSERLGREENLREANKRIEELVTSPAAAADESLMFAARLKQGDILRNLNEFAPAQRAYEDLVNRYPRRPDVVLAQLRLAECHNAQSSTDTADRSHAETAQSIFEQLRDRVDAPPDVRVEAGYNLGLLLLRRGKPEEAASVWWRDVIDPFLAKPSAPPFEAGAKRPYWLARTLRELAELLEKLGRFEEAKRAYLLLADKRLPHGAAVARARLEQLGARTSQP